MPRLLLIVLVAALAAVAFDQLGLLDEDAPPLPPAPARQSFTSQH